MNILVVGSAVIDLFLQLEDQNRLDIVGRKISFNLGDKVPIGIKNITLGGNGANVSVGLQRLSHDTTFYTYFGDDLFSKEIREAIAREGIKVKANEIKGGKSSLSFVFDINDDRIIFSHHEERQHSFSYQENQIPEFIFLTSIGKQWTSAYRQILDFLSGYKVRLSFNPGTAQLEEKTDECVEVIKHTRLLFVNKDEALRILSWNGIKPDNNVATILKAVKTLGPAEVSITDGANGAYAIDENNRIYSIKPFGNRSFVEKTGAGDAYTSGFLGKYLSNGNIPESMAWAGINAYASMQQVGSQDGLLRIGQLEKILLENRSYKAAII